MALLNHCISFFQFFFIFMMFNIPLSFNNIFLFFVLNSFLDQLPVITPKNIGISEIIFGYFAELSGASFDHGVLLKFFMRFSTLITLLILFFLLKFQRILLNICKSFKS
jgi:hypothetical protein